MNDPPDYEQMSEQYTNMGKDSLISVIRDLHRRIRGAERLAQASQKQLQLQSDIQKQQVEYERHHFNEEKQTLHIRHKQNVSDQTNRIIRLENQLRSKEIAIKGYQTVIRDLLAEQNSHMKHGNAQWKS